MQPDVGPPYQFSPYPVPGEETYVLNGREGQPNLRALMVGNLASITNALGGVTEISYELNCARDSVWAQDVYAGGLRVQKVRVHDGMDRAHDQVFQYEYEHRMGHPVAY